MSGLKHRLARLEWEAGLSPHVCEFVSINTGVPRAGDGTVVRDAYCPVCGASVSRPIATPDPAADGDEQGRPEGRPFAFLLWADIPGGDPIPASASTSMTRRGKHWTCLAAVEDRQETLTALGTSEIIWSKRAAALRPTI